MNQLHIDEAEFLRGSRLPEMLGLDRAECVDSFRRMVVAKVESMKTRRESHGPAVS